MGAKFECVVGGGSRQESAYKGLLPLGDVDSVIIHEAVRPLVSAADFRRLMDGEDENAMFGIPIPFTVSTGHDYIEDPLERDELVNVQLPQNFNRGKLLAAHEVARADGRDFTEDASLFFPYRGEGPDPPGHGAQHQDHRAHGHCHRRSDLRRPYGAGPWEGQAASSPARARASVAPRRSR